jgi:hypothetical protein
MTWSAIWQAVHGLLAGLEELARWKVSVDGVKAGPVGSVRVRAEGMRFGFEVQGADLTLEAAPGAPDHAVVKVNGKVDSDSRLVFSLRHTLTKPIIVVFEFRGVTVGGVTRRYRFDNPK